MMNTTTLRDISLGVDRSGQRPGGAWRMVLAAGAAAATLDMVYACTVLYFRHGMNSQRVMQSIASGFYGQAAYSGGWATAAVGFVAHYFILIVAAWWFFLASKYLRVLRERAVACGIAYGAAIYGTMNFIILPLSNAPFGSKSFDLAITLPRLIEFGMHLVFGVIIALVVRRYWRRADIH